MHIVLKSNFDVSGMLGAGSVELPEGASVGSLLDLLAERCRLELIDPGSGRVNSSDFSILLNGQEHLFWPKGLATPLRDADEVQLLVMPLTGG
jgi:ThiS family